VHTPAAVVVVMLAGHVSVGFWLSLTVTVNEQEPAVAPVQVTVVTPRLNVDPEAGLHVTAPHEPVVVGFG
jgi:hypothetical protein